MPPELTAAHSNGRCSLHRTRTVIAEPNSRCSRAVRIAQRRSTNLLLPLHAIHHRAGVRPHWLDLAATLFVGGLSCAWILRRYLTAAPLPLHAPELAKGLDYEASV